jgi:hypothetical protein
VHLSIDVDAAGQLHLFAEGGHASVAELHLGIAGATVSAVGCSPVLLPWVGYRPRLPDVTGLSPADSWEIAPWLQGRSGSDGVAVRAVGRYKADTQWLFRATTNWGRRVVLAMGAMVPGAVLPIVPSVSLASIANPECDTLEALCTVLCLEPALRERLGDRARVEALASDLAAGMLRWRYVGTGLGWDSTDIHVAMRQAGYVHQFTRPLDRAHLPSIDDAVGEVMARLAANPHRVGRPADHDEVEKIVRKDYLDIEPWPFAALTCDA